MPALIASVLFAFLVIAAWITHVVNCIQDQQWILLVIGIFVFPIGWIHGIGIWFGWF